MIRALGYCLITLGFSLTLASCSAVKAGSYTVGTIDANGYVFSSDGYWYANGYPYTRTATWNAGCGYGCNARPGYYTYSYSRYYPPQVQQAYTALVLPSYTDPGWRSKLLDIAAARDRDEAVIRKGLFEHAQYMEAVAGLGLSGNFRIQGYGLPAPYPTYSGGLPPLVSAGGVGYGAGNQGYVFSGSATYGATNASTQYGYTYNDLAKVYGDSNTTALFQMWAQNTQAAMALAGQAQAGFGQGVQQEGANRARVAEFLAKGAMAQQIIQALNVGPAEQNKQFHWKIEPAGGVIQRDDRDVDPKVRAGLQEDFKALFANRCGACHSGADAAGKFTMESYLAMPVEQKQNVWLRLVTSDEAKAMPRKTREGGVGERLSPAEFRKFVLN